MKILCKPNYRPFILLTPNFTLLGEVEEGKAIIAIDPYSDHKIKDKNGNEIITEGSVPEVYFESETDEDGNIIFRKI